MNCRKILTLASLGLLFSGLMLNADATEIAVEPRAVFVLSSLNKNDIVVEEPGLGIKPPFFTSDGHLAFALSAPARLRRYVQSESGYNNYKDELVGSMPKGTWYPYVSPGFLTFGGPLGFTFLEKKGVFEVVRYQIKNETPYVFAIDDLVICYDASMATTTYVGYVLDSDGGFKKLNHEETLEYIRTNVLGLTVRDGLARYRDNPLTITVYQTDDDGNLYSARTMYKNDKAVALIKSVTDKAFMRSTIDNEGNFWAVDFTKDADRHPVLFYAGRDWGYKEAPQKATSLTDGLRVRLRATTDGFILGKLSNGQVVTVLKTGQSMTIDGKTAPWYRIKTADGLIGWVFGGYLEVSKS